MHFPIPELSHILAPVAEHVRSYSLSALTSPVHASVLPLALVPVIAGKVVSALSVWPAVEKFAFVSPSIGIYTGPYADIASLPVFVFLPFIQTPSYLFPFSK